MPEAEINKLILRGMCISYYDVRRSETNTFVRLHVACDLSDPVREEMGWDPIADGIESANLSGELAASEFTICPNKESLQDSRITIPCSEVVDFKFARVKDGKGMRHELRFIIKTAFPGAAALLESYWNTIGDAAAQLRVRYTHQEEGEKPASDGEQPSLDLKPGINETAPSDEYTLEQQESLASARTAAGGTPHVTKWRGSKGKEAVANDQDEMDTGCVDCNNSIELAEGSTTIHASGAACTRRDVGTVN